MLKPFDNQRGLTLVELMIASVIGLHALSAVLSAYGAIARNSAQQLRAAHLHQQLHALMHLISRDLKRAGYWHFDPGIESPADNPFQNPVNRLRVHAHPGETRRSCVLFAYDLDKDGLVGTGRCDGADCPAETDGDNVEQFGFRLRNGGVQSRYAGRDFGCDTGYWQTITDTDVDITRLEFRERSRCLNLLARDQGCDPDAPRLIRRAIEIRLRGQLRGKPETGATLSQWVQVRNDVLDEAD